MLLRSLSVPCHRDWVFHGCLWLQPDGVVSIILRSKEMCLETAVKHKKAVLAGPLLENENEPLVSPQDHFGSIPSFLTSTLLRLWRGPFGLGQRLPRAACPANWLEHPVHPPNTWK